MPILMTCDCGATLRAKDEQAGKRTRCPSCSKILTIPTPDKVTAEKPRPAAQPASRPSAEVVQPKRRPAPSVDEDERPPARKPRRAADDEEIPSVLPADEDESPDDQGEDGEGTPRKRKRSSGPLKKKRRRSDVTADSGSSGFAYGIVGGLALMLLGAGLFVGLLLVGIIWPYAAILFIVGVIAFFKGLISGE